jgi:5-methyltetrahydropteroyltriglutamate--homocysteine methyltransferase
MQTAIIGFPRIGANRELKKATEAFFKNEITAEELEKQASNLRINNLKTLKNAGIDAIVTGDFSYYDNVLDTAILFNLLPKRFNNLDLSKLQSYFTIARGSDDTPALSLKKWFTTNYHYLVPEVDSTTKVKLNSLGPVKYFKEALNAGIQTMPTIIGPFTLLKLANFANNVNINNIKKELIKSYIELLDAAKNAGSLWFSIEEPYLVTDLDNSSIQLFKEIYEEILKNRPIKIKLQTYFGDLRDVFKEVSELYFDGVGLDFIEGPKNLDLLKEFGLTKGTTIFAGIISGRNIWRNDYQNSLKLIDALAKLSDNIILSSACSLLHVPITIQNEKLDNKYLKHFAFAIEKLSELKDLALCQKYQISAKATKEQLENQLASLNDSSPEFYTIKNYLNNLELHSYARINKNLDLATKIQKLKETDFIREPKIEERARIQQKSLNLPLLPTTTIGSFPQTLELRTIRKKHRLGEISDAQYSSEIKRLISECIKLQERLDLDVLVHGEFERNDMVEYFGEKLHGFIFTTNGWVQSYGTRCVKPPIIWEDIYRQEPMTVETAVFAQSLTPKPVKGMLTGPVTIFNWSFPREDISVKETVLQIAIAIRDEVLDLEKAGIKIIQIDEAALKEKLPIRKINQKNDYLNFAIPAFRLTHSGVDAKTQIHTHMCYSEFRDIIDSIAAMDADVISFEASRSSLSILSSLNAENFLTAVGPGIYDIHSPRVPSIAEIKKLIEQIITKLPTQKIWITPDCGLKTRNNDEATSSLTNMMLATKEIRQKLS